MSMFGISELKVWFLLSLVQKLLEIRLISDKTQSLQGPIVVKINYNSGTGVKISFFTIFVGTNTNKLQMDSFIVLSSAATIVM